MPSNLNLDYYYGSEAEQYSFYRIPKVLPTDPRYKSVSIEAKVLYGLLLDRMGLSVKNGWMDGDRRVYIYFTQEDAMEMMDCGHNKAVRLFADLELTGLIERKRQGQGRPTRIYVKNFILPPPDDQTPEPEPPQLPEDSQTSGFGKSDRPVVREKEVLTSDFGKSALPESGGLDFPKRDAIGRLATVRENPGDYINPDDGLLYCGRCHTPKTALLVLPELTGTDEPRLFPVACQCQEEAAEKERREAAAAEFSATVRGRWDRYGFHDSGLLRHTFSDDDSGQQQITDTLRRYVSKWDDMRQNNVGIMLYGPVGVGKSFFASILCNALLKKQVSVCATSFSRILNVLQSSPDRQAVLDRLEGFQLAFIDDLGAERDTPYAVEQIFSVIDSRYRVKKPVLITTNLIPGFSGGIKFDPPLGLAVHQDRK